MFFKAKINKRNLATSGLTVAKNVVQLSVCMINDILYVLLHEKYCYTASSPSVSLMYK